MRITEVRVEGAERNLIIRYGEAPGKVQIQVCSQGWTELEPAVDLDIPDSDEAWIAAESAHVVCEGRDGTNGDVDDYYNLFLRATP